MKQQVEGCSNLDTPHHLQDQSRPNNSPENHPTPDVQFKLCTQVKNYTLSVNPEEKYSKCFKTFRTTSTLFVYSIKLYLQFLGIHYIKQVYIFYQHCHRHHHQHQPPPPHHSAK